MNSKKFCLNAITFALVVGASGHAMAAQKVAANGALVNKNNVSSLAAGNAIKTKEAKRIQVAPGKFKVKLQQTHNGIPVWGSAIVVTEQNNQYSEHFGDVVTGLNTDVADTAAAISAKQAESITSNYLLQTQALNANAPSLGLTATKIAKNKRNAKNDQYIYVDQSGKARLVYHVSYVMDENGTPTRPNYIVDAKSG